jgi:hypothetical protein
LKKVTASKAKPLAGTNYARVDKIAEAIVMRCEDEVPGVVPTAVPHVIECSNAIGLFKA